MDNRITKTRLKNFLSYEWILMIIATVAGIVVWNLAFTMLAPRITNGQEYYLYIYGDITTSEYDILNKCRDDGYFSYDVRKIEYMKLDTTYAETQLQAYVGAGQGDSVIVTKEKFDYLSINYQPLVRLDETGKVVIDIANNDLVSRAYEYCEKYGNIIDGNYVVDDNKITTLFYDRKSKDKRFKTQEEKLLGISLEKERVEKIYSSAKYLENVFNYATENGIQLGVYAYLKISDDGQSFKFITEDDFNGDVLSEDIKDITLTREEFDQNKKVYGINLESLGSGIVDYFSTYYKNPEDETKYIKTEKGVYLTVLNMTKEQPHLQYESVSFIEYFLKTYSDLFDEI